MTSWKDKEQLLIRVKTILAPTDLSELSKAGLSYALNMAVSLGAEVIVYQVIGMTEEWFARHDDFFSIEEFVDQRRVKLAAFVQENFADVASHLPIRTEVEVGVPYEMIVEEALKQRVDLIVMSTHGRSGLSRMMIGSVTQKVLRRAPCPVLSIRPTAASGDEAATP